MKKLILILGLAIIGLVSSTYAASIFRPYQGGTGIGTANVGDIGTCLKVSDNSPFTFELGACGSGGGDGNNMWATSTDVTAIRPNSADTVLVGTTTPDRANFEVHAAPIADAQSTAAYIKNHQTNDAASIYGLYVDVKENDGAAATAHEYGVYSSLAGNTTGYSHAVVGNTSGSSALNKYSFHAIGGTIYCEEKVLATSTSMTVNWTDGCSQVIRMGTSNMTVNFTGQQAGMNLTLTTCSPASGTAGTLTLSGVLFSGGVHPSNTTTANKCDKWFLSTSNASSTAVIMLDGMSGSY